MTTPAEPSHASGDGFDMRRTPTRSDSGARSGLVRVVRTLALLSTGLLAGAFGYGAVNVVQAFQSVPPDVRFTFHAALMRMNGPVMQTAMGVAVLSALLLAILLRNTPRLLAAGAGALTLTSFLVTRFGNVPINGQIKVWATGSAPADYADILRRWELLNNVRTVAAVAAFVLLLAVVDRALARSVDGRALAPSVDDHALTPTAGDGAEPRRHP